MWPGRECDIIPNWCYQRRSFLVRVASLLLQKTYLVTFLAFLPQPCNQTLQKHLGYFNDIFRLSHAVASVWPRNVIKECYQEMLPMKSLSYINIYSLIRHNYLATFLVFLPHTMQPRNSGHAGEKNQSNNTPHQKCWFISFLKNYTILTKEGSTSTTLYSNCKHSLNLCVTSTKGMQLR